MHQHLAYVFIYLVFGAILLLVFGVTAILIYIKSLPALKEFPTYPLS